MLNKKAVINNSLFYLQNYYKYRISEITPTQVFHLFILRQLTLWCIQDFQIDCHTAGFLLPMIFSGYIFSIVIFSYYFLLHNVRIKRYFSPNLIPTNYSALCSSRNFIICLYIYSIKATLQIIHPKSGHPYFYQILMVSIPVYSFLHKKTS